MKNTALKVLLAAAILIPLAVYAQPRPGNPTTATVITKAEIDKISATAFIDGKVVNGRRSTNNPDGGPNGPGCGGGVAVGARKVELKVGDVLIVPPGVIHGWFDIPDHVDYLSFRPSHGVMKNGWVNPTIAPK